MSDIEEVARRVAAEITARSKLLIVYGMTAVMTGILMSISGGPFSVEEQFGSWTRVAFGVVAVIGGACMTIGAPKHASDARAWYTAVSGAALICLWLITMSAVYLAAVVDDGFTLAWPHESIPRTAGKPWFLFFFTGMSLGMGVHLEALLRRGRPAS